MKLWLGYRVRRGKGAKAWYGECGGEEGWVTREL